MITVEDLKRAIGQNILVYDQNNNKGVITHRLLGLMMDVTYANCGAKLTEFYATRPTSIEYPHIYSTVFGFEIKYAGFNLEEEYKVLGGTFPGYNNFENIVVGVGPNNLIMLGCY